MTWWEWRRDANLGHEKHIHISFTDKAEKDGRPFLLPIFATKAALAPAKKTTKKTTKKVTPP